MSADITVIAPDYPGEYVVLYRGLDAWGDFISAETTFIVNLV